MKAHSKGAFLSLLATLSSPSELLFNVSDGESGNVLADYKEKHQELKEKYGSWDREKSFEGALDDVEAEFNDQQLRDLGYLE
jgi:hypothetical protein